MDSYTQRSYVEWMVFGKIILKWELQTQIGMLSIVLYMKVYFLPSGNSLDLLLPAGETVSGNGCSLWETGGLYN